MNVSRTIFTRVKPGVCIELASTVTPKGFLDCTAAYLNIADYPRLYEAIGHQFDLITDTDPLKFRLPGVEGLSIVGAGQGTGLSNRIVGNKGGSKTHVLTTAEMPSHTHLQDPHSHSMHSYTPEIGVSGSTSQYKFQTTGSSQTSSAAPLNHDEGGGLAHNNLQQYIVLKKYIKY